MYIKQTHSTSTLLREQYTDDLPHLYTIRTDFQTAGRGQAGNSWESEEGKNLLFSSLLRYEGIYAADQWRLSMLVAVACWEVLAKYLPKDWLTIKWPNDIVLRGKKVCGILTEMITKGEKIDYIIDQYGGFYYDLLKPALTEIIQQGIELGEIHFDKPAALAEIVLIVLAVKLGNTLIPSSKEEVEETLKGLIILLEKGTDNPAGSLNFLTL